MIKSFKSKETEKIWKGKAAKALPLDIQHGARRKLRMLNNANDLNDIRIPPAKSTGMIRDLVRRLNQIEPTDWTATTSDYHLER